MPRSKVVGLALSWLAEPRTKARYLRHFEAATPRCTHHLGPLCDGPAPLGCPNNAKGYAEQLPSSAADNGWFTKS